MAFLELERRLAAVSKVSDVLTARFEGRREAR